MQKQVVVPQDKVFATPGGGTIFERFGYAAAVRAGGLVFVSGQIGINPDGTVPADAASQITNAFERLKLVLRASGCDFADVVDLVTYHVGMQSQWADFVRIKAAYIKEPFPAWTAIGVAELARPGLLVEIKAVALAPGK